MPRCRYCGKALRGGAEQTGARCPRCHEPLFERLHIPRQLPEGGTAAGGLCAAHPRNLAIGTCQRCGNYLCPVCRTRWRDKVVCTACVERALESGERAPEEARAHTRQAALALVLGIAGWVVLGAIFAMIVVMIGQGQPEREMVIVLGLAVLASPVFSMLGLGQAIAAVRARGNHMIMATSGLLLSGLQIGVVVGLLLLSAWNT